MNIMDHCTENGLKQLPPMENLPPSVMIVTLAQT